MIRKVLLSLIMLLLAMLLATCGGTEAQQPYYDATTIFTSGRARAEYLEDLSHLYNTLVANWPFVGVIYRTMGVDMHQLYIEARAHFETVDDIRSDNEFAIILNRLFIQPFSRHGHFDMLRSDFLRMHIEAFNNAVVAGDDWVANFLSEINNPATRALHGLTDEDFALPDMDNGGLSLVYATTPNNVQTRIIEYGRIAYVNILHMNSATMELDRITLLDFFHHVANYEHLIIDIRQNGGGISEFFPNLVMSPNISQPLETYFYMFTMDGDHNQHLMALHFGDWRSNGVSNSAFSPIHGDLLNHLVYLNPFDAELLDLYYIWHGGIDPIYDEAIFGGRIWLLISEWNFSVAEQAAFFSKQTGFATLVGQTTRGDGLGFQPLVLALPNTGIVVRYSSIYGTDPLGRNNQEFGTDPHYFNRPNMDALQTVLAMIEESMIEYHD